MNKSSNLVSVETKLLPEAAQLLDSLEMAYLNFSQHGKERSTARMEMGQIMSRLQAEFSRQGARDGGPTLVSELRRRKIPRASAYRALAAYEVSTGKKAPVAEIGDEWEPVRRLVADAVRSIKKISECEIYDKALGDSLGFETCSGALIRLGKEIGAIDEAMGDVYKPLMANLHSRLDSLKRM